MKKWVELILQFPKTTIILIIFVSVLSVFGVMRVKFDTSTDAMMPKNNLVYKLNQRSKMIFGDSKTYVLTAIEAPEGKEIFTKENFILLHSLVTELNEFRSFNKREEDERFGSLLKQGNIILEKQGEPIKHKIDRLDEFEDIETELDKEIFGDEKEGASVEKVKSKDIWDTSRPVKRKKLYAKAIRLRNTYSYQSYKPVSIAKLKVILKAQGSKQLLSILKKHKMEKLAEDKLLTKGEFKTIVEAWESVYLFKSMEIIKMLLDPVTGSDIHGENNQIFVKSFLPADKSGDIILPQTKKDFISYKKRLKENPSYKSVLYSLNAKGEIRALAVSIVLRPLENHIDVFNYIHAVIKKYNGKRLKLTPVGIPVYEKFIFDYMNRDLRVLIPLVLAVIILTFLLDFRSLRGVFLPTLSVMIGTLWVVGLMGFLNVPITMMVNMLPALLVSVGSSYAIHIFNQYLHDRDTVIAADPRSGLAQSMSHISSTVVLASLTTVIGFSTLAVSELISLKHLGIFSALGSFFAMGVAVTFIPVVLMLLKPRKRKNLPASDDIKRNRIVGRVIIIFDHLSQQRAKAVVVAAVIVAVAGFVGMNKIKLASTPMNNFKKDSYLYKAEFMMGDIFDGSLTMNLVFDSGKRDGVKDPVFLKNIEKIRTWLTSPANRENYQMLHTAAFGDFIKRINKAMHNEDPACFTVPDSKETINDYMRLYSGVDENSDGRIDALEPFVDAQFRYANILIRVGSIKGRLYSSHLIEVSKKAIEEYVGSQKELKGYSWRLIGETMNFMVISRMIISGQLKSIMFTLIVVAIVILLLFRNFKASLVSIFPISMAIIVSYGTMGYLNIPLDISKSLLSAIAIGIGVDDTIHMLKTLKFHLHRGLGLSEAMDATYREAGTAIVYTSLALILGFSVLLLSEFLPIFYLSILMIVTIVTTTVSALVLLPGIIFLFKLNIDEELNWKIFKILNFKKFFEIEK